MGPFLVWHRGDLRLHDHPALLEALAQGPVVGLVVLDPNNLKTTPRRRAWFLENVRALREAYRARGGALWVLEGFPWEKVPEAAKRLRAKAVYALRSYTPYGRHRDARVAEALPVPLHLLPAPHLLPPDLPKPYRVYTPFSRLYRGAAPPLPPPEALPKGPEEGEIPREDPGLPLPEPGEEAALRRLRAFLEAKLPRYAEERDRLDGEGGSRLSPYFALGVLSPRLAAWEAEWRGGEGARKWVAELLWRDFSYHLLYHFPWMTEKPLDPRFQALPWEEDEALFQAWYEGKTGVPLVDAAMRELHATGFLSNRARMNAAQFAVKYLLLPWKRAEEAFRHLLLDGDRAVNLQGWQWAGGLGVDAAPYFRVFNPVLQGERHDPEGRWLKRWAPEYPSYAPKDPVVDLEEARRRYLRLAKGLPRG
ncbi:deoxyribodipyrimidine photo-lyase (plasmid) [Thermus thermophilus]|uniref:deoxyribodipyrimidine photo-lyase n=1 Tax=Thermus thermophilus TaxID=274 RepID=UPI001C76854A|nr:deoxyribodipyrimidine photo-lyase [Thermus thermophilus]BCZ93151.1 deoxyribodipyrimidine photo-lyase [Thermus thermophilus]BCZ95534.1 deoxyribodipyrimidine photo-lyase [Thermus thermophilus]